MTGRCPPPTVINEKANERAVITDKERASHATTPRAKVVCLAVGGALAHEAADALRQALTGAGYATSVIPAADLVSGHDQAETEPAVGVVLADDDDPVIASLTEMWHAAGVPSLAVVLEHPDVRIGPLDVPGTDLCAACFTMRVHQHEPIPPPDRETEPVERGPAIGVGGIPPYLAAVVASLAVDRLGVLDAEAADRRNEVTAVNTATLVTRTHQVIPVNMCPQCGDQKPVGVLGGGEPMFPELNGVPR